MNYKEFFKIVQMLEDNKSYRDISHLLHISSKTISKVSVAVKEFDIKATEEFEALKCRSGLDNIIRIDENYSDISKLRGIKKKDIYHLYCMNSGLNAVSYRQFARYIEKPKSKANYEPANQVVLKWSKPINVKDEYGKLFKSYIIEAFFPYSGYIIGIPFESKTIENLIESIVILFNDINGKVKTVKSTSTILSPDNPRGKYLLDIMNYYHISFEKPTPLELKTIDLRCSAQLEKISERELPYNELSSVVASFFDGQRISGCSISRKSCFEYMEKPRLSALPSDPFEATKYKSVKAGVNCHFMFDGTYYSVPWRSIGQNLMIEVSKSKIKVFDDYNHLITIHDRTKDKYMTLAEHMPPSNAKVPWTKQRFLEWAGRYGKNTQKAMEIFLSSQLFEQQGYSAARAMLAMGKNNSELTEKVFTEIISEKQRISLKTFREKFEIGIRMNWKKP